MKNSLSMIRIGSYNCKSSRRNAGGIHQLCELNDIIFLQEHWLMPFEIPSLDNVHLDFMSHGISSVDPSDRFLEGRPFGGVAVLWRNSLGSFVKSVSFGDDRIVGLELQNANS